MRGINADLRGMDLSFVIPAKTGVQVAEFRTKPETVV